jgi:hypothetical protein
MGVGGQRHAPAALPPVRIRYPLYRRLGGLQGRSGRVLKISPPPGFDPRNVQPVASRYTDWAIPAHSRNHLTILNSICIYCWEQCSVTDFENMAVLLTATRILEPACFFYSCNVTLQVGSRVSPSDWEMQRNPTKLMDCKPSAGNGDYVAARHKCRSDQPGTNSICKPGNISAFCVLQSV